MAQPEHVAERIRGRQRHRAGADDRRVEQQQREDRAQQRSTLSGESDRAAQRVGESAELVGAIERRGVGDHDGRRAKDHHPRADDRVGTFVPHPARSDALVDDVRLLEEQLPGRNGGANDGDDQQHRIRAHSTRDTG